MVAPSCETRVRILTLDAACRGHGLAYLPLDLVQGHLHRSTLLRVLDKFTPDLPGYHLYYPNRRHPSPAFALLVETMRFRA